MDMTRHERFLATMRYQPVDRPPLWEWAPWTATLRRWQREALGEGKNAPQYAENENRVQCGVDLWMRPRYEIQELSRDERYITRRTDRGQIERFPSSPDETSMPEYIGFPVKSRKDWEELKSKFDPSDPGRFPNDWNQRCAEWKEDGPVLVLQGPRSPSLFGFVRELMGPEEAMLAFYDDPDMVHDMMDVSTEMAIGMLSRVVKDAPLSAVYLWEDMCYKCGPLISPAMFREFMSPRYKRITEHACGLGIDLVFVDSDGDVSKLIPLWIDAGVNGIYPMEVAAGMDVVKLRREYGRDLLMTGGIDKRVMALGRDAIDAELAAKIPLVEQGGYIPHADHAIPADVPYEAFAYYWEKKKELLGLTTECCTPC